MNDIMRTERDILEHNILRGIGKILSGKKSYEITGFLAEKGNLYNGELMVVGRALNGWVHCKSLSALTDQSECKAYAEKIEERNKSEQGSLTWLKELWENPNSYNPKRSAFWRVIRQVVEGLHLMKEGEAASSFTSHIVWSNLYKVGPNERRNPNGKLCEAQLQGCRTLLEHEIKTYKPSRLLLITGWNWASSFLDVLGNIEVVDQTFVEAAGYLPDTGTRVVVTVRPERVKGGERAWVEEIMSEFGK